MEKTPTLVRRLIALHPLVIGIAATLLAAFSILAWIAIGLFFLPSSIRERDELVTSSALLVGSAVTGFLYALAARAGYIDGGILLVAIISLAAVVARIADLRRILGSTATVYRDAFTSNRLLRFASPVVAALLWIYAIAPPRDGDVMRYHLAHIRQIIADGRWEAIADYHYAFPFGWTLNYLPFERLHLPQAAALVNVAIWIVIVGGLLRLARLTRAPRLTQLATIFFFVHPFVLRTFASAMADAQAILVVFAIALCLLHLDDTQDDALVLGFACWVGAQSRYQLIAWGIAGTCVAGFIFARRKSGSEVKQFTIGAAGALLFCAPFYFANWKDFGNPVWPLFVPSINGTAAYADRVAAAYTAAMTGSHNPTYLLNQLWDLVTNTALAPLAALLILIVPLSIRAKDRRFKRVAVLGSLFLLLWILMEPKLFARHVLLLLPLGAMLSVWVMHGSVAQRRTKLIQQTLSIAITLFVVVSAAFSWDYARYAVTGDRNTYHRFTWYYRVYDWVNHNTPPNARLLVITYSGHSYYLDRPYRRADPWLSGVVDWSRIKTGNDLISVLNRGGYSYVLYDDRSWASFPSGAEMESAIKSAVTSGSLVQVHGERERLYTSRARRKFDLANVYVFRVAHS